MKPNPSATISIKAGYGYSVRLSNGVEYHAGDSQYDSALFGTGDLSVADMDWMARQTATEMMQEQFGTIGKIVREDNMFEGVV